MNNKKRNQLIGFITLVLIALLIAPYVLTDKSRQNETTIPLLSSADDIDSQLVHDFDDLNTPDESLPVDTLANNDPDVIPQIIPPVIDDTSNVDNEQNTSKNYIIQLVALKNKRKIEELIALLRLHNYDAYTIPQIPQEGLLTRLLVGPYLTKEQADLVIIDLEHLTKLSGFVTTK